MVSEEYAVLVINTREHQGLASEALARSLFHELKTSTMNSPSLSVSIHPVISNSVQTASWSISIESSRSIKRCLVKEFFFPPTPGLSTSNYLLWILKSPARIAAYLTQKLREIWHEAVSTEQKLLGILHMIIEVLLIGLHTIYFVYFILPVSLIVIRTLRKIGNVMLLLYSFMIIFIILLATWKLILPPFISSISRFTEQLIELVPGSGVTFDILFPVMATIVFGFALTFFVALLAKIARWIIRERDTGQEGNPRTMVSNLSYLLDPVYASKVRDNFERQLMDLNNDSNVQHILLVCQDTGGLLAYEVLSRACREQIIKPVHLLTRNTLSISGFTASPVRSLWLLVDHIYWDRFSQTTPENLSWLHLTTWPVYEISFKLTSRAPHTIPQVQLHSERHPWFKRTNTVLIDRLISLMKLA